MHKKTSFFPQLWCFPNAGVFPGTTVASPERNFSALDASELLASAGDGDAAALAAAVQAGGGGGVKVLSRSFDPIAAPPDVEVMCVWGRGFSTPVALSYPRGLPRLDRSGGQSGRPVVIAESSDGDGTVAAASLAACMAWGGRQEPEVRGLVLEGVSHVDTIFDKTAMALFLRRAYARPLPDGDPGPNVISWSTPCGNHDHEDER